jgi:prepilin-type N-terminal cleavage/methylation domain-containing protein
LSVEQFRPGNRAIPRRGEYSVRSRYGFTLVETLIVVVLLGLMTAIGFPKMRSAMVRNELRGARITMVNLAAKARAVAAQSSRLTWIKIEGSTAHVLASPRTIADGVSTVDTVGTVQDFAATYGVAVAVTPGGVDAIQFDPRGFGMGFGAVPVSIVLSRGGYSSTITIDGLGRVIQ